MQQLFRAQREELEGKGAVMLLWVLPSFGSLHPSVYELPASVHPSAYELPGSMHPTVYELPGPLSLSRMRCPGNGRGIPVGNG